MPGAEETGWVFVQGMWCDTVSVISDSSTKGLNPYLSKLSQTIVLLLVCALGQAEARLTLVWAVPGMLCLAGASCSAKQEESKQKNPSGRTRQVPSTQHCLYFASKKKAAAETFCLFSCSVLTALRKKWSYSCSEPQTLPKWVCHFLQSCSKATL